MYLNITINYKDCKIFLYLYSILTPSLLCTALNPTILMDVLFFCDIKILFIQLCIYIDIWLRCKYPCSVITKFWDSLLERRDGYCDFHGPFSLIGTVCQNPRCSLLYFITLSNAIRRVYLWIILQLFCTASLVTHNSAFAKIRTFYLSTVVIKCEDFPVFS